MKAAEVAKKYFELCKANQYEAALELFSPDAVSVEAMEMPNFPIEAKGLAAIADKGKRWFESHEVHHVELNGPWPNGNRFIVRFRFDVTDKASKRRLQLDEAGLFTVENGKIVREEFFYATDG